MTRGTLLRWANMATVVAAMGFAAAYLAANGDDVARIVTTAEPRLLLLGIGLLTAFVLLQGALGTLVMKDVGASVPFRVLLPVVILSLLGKYMPGKVWVITMRMGVLSRHDVGAGEILAGSVLEHVFAIFTGIILFLAFPTVPIPGLHPWVLPAAAAACGLLFVLLPGAVHAASNRALGVFGRPPLARWPSRGRSLAYTLLYSGTWIILGQGIVLTVRSVDPSLSPSLLLPLTGAYAVSVTAGLLAVFAPGGLGVREGLFVVALTPHMSPVAAVFAAVASRVTLSLAEFLAMGMVLPLHRRSR